MKLAPLLAKYLYTHKRLELPGLGTFLLDPHVLQEEDNRAGNNALLQGVSFENKPAVRDSPELIQFIMAETGKIKALALADLASHLEQAQQFLNIGKPFLFEGVGSLVKLRNGEFNFISGQIMNDAMPEKHQRENEEYVTTSGSDNDFKSVFYGQKSKSSFRKPLVFLLVISGLAFAIWGGYTVYKRSAPAETEIPATEELKSQEIIVAKDSLPIVDSIIPSTITDTSTSRKFILETADAKRVVERYNKLKSFQWNVYMETNDSVMYKLFVRLPASAMDTTRILDSLTRMNGRKVYIE